MDYRKQMEEMYISLNKTINRLADTSRKAEEKVFDIPITSVSVMSKDDSLLLHINFPQNTNRH